MRNRIKNFFSAPFFKVLKKNKKKSSIFFIFIFMLNISAALLEGISISIIFYALNALDQKLDTSYLPYFLSSFLIGKSYMLIFSFFIILAVFFQFLRSALTYLGQVLVTTLSTGLQADVQKEIYKRIFRFTFARVSKYKVGDLIEYASSPSLMMSSLIDSINQSFVSFFTCSTLLIILLCISTKLTLVVFISFMLMFFFQKHVVKKISNISKRLVKFQTEFSKKTVQNLQGLRIIFTFNRQEETLKRTKNNIESISKVTKKQLMLTHLLTPFSEIMSIMLVGICLIVGPFFLKTDTVAVLFTFLMITYRLSTRAQIFSTSIGVVAKQTGFIQRMNEIFRDEDKEFTQISGIPYQGFQEKIEFKNVEFKYGKHLKGCIEKISFSALKGQTIAFVGSSGAGKSTLLDLLIRLYEPNRGQILVDGKNLNDFNINSWRNHLGVVSQDTFVFHGTIEENIRFGLLEATKEKIINAAKLAGALEFTLNLPQGFQTVVGERGYRLSGGERQRLALARALVRNPEILILDEATSNLDSHSEYFIQKALEKLQHKVTIIMVAHRLSTIKKADQIIFVESGKIIEKGTHEELLALKGRYAFFWEIQSKNEEYSYL